MSRAGRNTTWRSTNCNVQDAEIALTDAQIAKTEIRAPFDGMVGLRYVSEGAFVNRGDACRDAAAPRRLKVDFSVPEKYATRMRVGSPIHFTVAGGARRFEGAIYAIDPRIDAATRTVLDSRAVPEPAVASCLPGAFANVELTLGRAR